jgi:hypothetical protein
VETIHWHRQDGQAKVPRILIHCAGAILMTFYNGLPLIGKDTPTIEPTGTIVHENTLLFLPGSEFPGHLLHQHHIGASYLIGHCICYATYINFQVSLYHFISLVAQAQGGESVDGLCTEACSHTCQLQSMSFPVHYLHSCYVRLNAVSFYMVCL